MCFPCASTRPTPDQWPPDAEVLEETLSALHRGAESNPILVGFIPRIEAALAATGDDGDADGISDAAEAQLSGLLTEALAATSGR